MSSESSDFEALKSQIQEKDLEIMRLKQLLIEKEACHDQCCDESVPGKQLLPTLQRRSGLTNNEPHSGLTNSDVGRYSRQLILPEFGVQGQVKLQSTSVLIVGAGGLGCPAAIYLAAAGIGRLGVVDYDEVELSNLHRQILHTSDRVGMSKSLSVARSCYRLNSSVEYVPYQLQLSSSNALDIISSYDIVLDATDNVATRYLLNDACVLAGKTLVSGSALRFEGQLTVYNCEGGPCYRCLFPKPPPPETVTNCSEGGVIGVVPGIIGSIQALEAIKIAAGIGTSYSQRLLLFDALDGTFRTIKLRPRSPSCTVCGDNPSITQLIDYVQFCGAAASDKEKQLTVLDEHSRISATEYKSMLSDGVDHLLVDVRPEVETHICRLPHPSLNISHDDFTRHIEKTAQKILLALQEKKGNDKKCNTPLVVCVCRRGNDSQHAVLRLQEELSRQQTTEQDGSFCDEKLKKVRIIDIRGGLHAWARHVDKDFPVY